MRLGTIGWGRIAAALVAAVAVVCTAMVSGAPTARADFTVQMCGGGAPAPPWINGLEATQPFSVVNDECASGNGTVFQLASATMAPNAEGGAGIQTPSGEVLTHVLVQYHSQATSSGSEAFLRVAHNTGFLLNSLIGDAHAGTQIDAALPDSTLLYFNVFCSTSASTSCTFPSSVPLRVGAMKLTVHDTGQPSVQSLGGSAVAPGAHAGVQTLGYQATDGGSGVARVTVSLGATVVGSAQSACQSFSLTPCPRSVSGTAQVDTRLVPDGTYPVILTAYDVSGDPMSSTAGSATVRNHSRTVTLRLPRRRKGVVHTRIETGWHWNGARTKLTKIVFKKLSRGATVTVRCQGRRCPFKTRRAKARHVRTLERRLRGTSFRVGERLELTVSQPHLRAERGEVRFRRGRVPLMRRR